MTLNAHTDLYGTLRRAKNQPYRSVYACQRMNEQGVRLDPNGSLEERCAWMRERQRERRNKETSERAFQTWQLRRGKQGSPESNVA